MTRHKIPLFLSALCGLIPLSGCQATRADKPAAHVAGGAPQVTGPCATRSDNPKPLPEHPGPEFFQDSFGGLWYLEGDDRKAHDFGLNSPNSMIYRVTGIRGFGGVVPIRQDALAPWTFSQPFGTAIIFITTDCAELRDAPRGVVTNEVIGLFLRKG